MTAVTLTAQLMGVGVPGAAASTAGAETVGASPSQSVSTGLTATGTTIADGLALVSLINVVATTAASTGVLLPDVDIGVEVIIQNNGANALNLFPNASTVAINGGTLGAAVTIAAAAGNRAIRLSATDWLVSVFAKES